MVHHQHNISSNGLHLFGAHYAPGSMQYAYIIRIFSIPLWVILLEKAKINGFLFIFDKVFEWNIIVER